MEPEENEGHLPVLKDELVEYLALSQSDTVIDATIGFGGHAEVVLNELGSDGELIGFEKDPGVFQQAGQKFKSDSRVRVINCSYIALDEEVSLCDAIYFDLGICSYHLQNAGRGFSFRKPSEPFDCRFNPESERPPAWKIINKSSRDRLREILREFGEVRFLGPVLKELCEKRPVKTVGDIVSAVEAVVYPPKRRGELARVFQAFRIAVNRELDELRQGLESALDLLKRGGRLVVISFHSLEDRIVKHFFREASRECICPPELPVCACDQEKICNVVTQSPVIPEKEEIEANSKASSAKLRAVEKI